MKISAFVPVLILVAAALFGWKGHQQLNKIDNEYQQLLQKAKVLGLSLEGSHQQISPSKIFVERRKAADPVTIETLAGNLIKAFNQLDENEASNYLEEGAIWLAVEKLAHLNPTQVQQITQIVKESSEVDDRMRVQMMGAIVVILSEKSPQTAFTFLKESGDLLGNREWIQQRALTHWAANDSAAALTWIEKNFDSDTDALKKGAINAVIKGTARNNPKKALHLLNQLGAAPKNMAIQGIVESATDTGKRLALLDTVRSEVSDPIVRDQMIGTLAAYLSRDGFQASMDWLEKANLGATEIESFSNAILNRQSQGDAGSWLAWMNQKTPEEKRARNITQLMQKWVNQDFRSAADWLNQLENEELKQLAVPPFARKISHHDPASAAAWARTLPAGKQRDSLLREILQKWHQIDPEAASLFMREHEITKDHQ